MGVTEAMAADEQVIFFRDSKTNVRGITVLGDQSLGPAVGACRRRPYDDEERALADAVRQSRSTTAKAVMAGLPVSGGCTVLLNDPAAGSAKARSQALGQAIEDLKGRYILMPDPEDRPEDMDEVALMTKHVLGTKIAHDLDPATATAMGALNAMEVAVRHKLGRVDLAGLRVSIMGLAPPGYRLAEHLRLQGVKVVVADRDPRRTERAVRELGIACVTIEEIVHLDADIFAPCISKDVIDDDCIAHLRCSIVAGTGDDLFRMPTHGQDLHDRGILYAPDFITAAGGMISLVARQDGADASGGNLESEIQAIGDRLQAIFDQAARENRATSVIAEEQLRQRLADRVASSGSGAVAFTA